MDMTSTTQLATFFTEFFGWMTLFHFVSMLVIFFVLTVLEDFVYNLHQNILGLDKSVLKPMYTKIMGNYKMMWIVFALAPYLALKMMGY
jgi:hypothetical protein